MEVMEILLFQVDILSIIAFAPIDRSYWSFYIDVVELDSETRGPRFMLLNLLQDNGDTSKHWQLVPSANSYNVRMPNLLVFGPCV